MAIVDLPEGEHQYKFCVDGQWTLDPTGVSANLYFSFFLDRTDVTNFLFFSFLFLLSKMSLLFFLLLLSQAVMTAKTGTVNNVIQVKRTDFEVFDALKIDSEESADISGTNSCFNEL